LSTKPYKPQKAQEALQPYLDFANLLGQSRELPPPYALKDDGFGGSLFEEVLGSLKSSGRFRVPLRVLSKVRRGRGRLVGWLRDAAAPEGGWRLSILSLYENFYAIRETARRIAEAVSASGSALSIPIPPRAGMLKVREDGTLQPVRGVYEGFLDLLERVDVTRIRRCPVCQNLYYAWRKDKGACSENCCNVWNVRNSRSPEKAAEYKFNRIKAGENRERQS
jgi:hypothetical protein